MKSFTLQRLKAISEDENLQDDFIENLNNQIMSDEEVPRRKVAQLMEAYDKDPSLTNDILMALCGWTMDSLIDQTLKVGDDEQ